MIHVSFVRERLVFEGFEIISYTAFTHSDIYCTLLKKAATENVALVMILRALFDL